MERDHPHESSDQLQIWITKEFSFRKSQGLIKNHFENNHQKMYSQTNWKNLIDLGFVEQLFYQIDQAYFSKFFIQGQRKRNFQKSLHFQQYQGKIESFYCALKQYFKDVMGKKITEKYQEEYLNFGQKYSGKEMNTQALNFSFDQSINKGNIQNQSLKEDLFEIIKFQFYILVNLSNRKLQNQPSINGQSNFQNDEKMNDVTADETKTNIHLLDAEGFIARICQLPEHTQTYLMNELKKIQSEKLQQIPQMRNLYNKLEEVNEQNYCYKEQIEQIIQENQKLQQQIKQIIKQQEKFNHEITNYQNEKKQLFDYFRQNQDIQLHSVEQFVDILRHIQQQNSLLSRTIAELQQKNYQLETSNADYVHRINKKAKQITKTNEDIKKYKTQIKSLMTSIELYDGLCDQSQADLGHSDYVLEQGQRSQEKQIPCGILRQNKDFYNKDNNMNSSSLVSSFESKSSLRKKYGRIFTDRIAQNNSSVLQKSQNKSVDCSFIKSQSGEGGQIKNQQELENVLIPLKQSQIELKQSIYLSTQKNRHQKVLMKKLQQLYKEISDLTGEITTIKQQNTYYSEKNRASEKKIRSLRFTHEAFMRQLEYYGKI